MRRNESDDAPSVRGQAFYSFDVVLELLRIRPVVVALVFDTHPIEREREIHLGEKPSVSVVDREIEFGRRKARRRQEQSSPRLGGGPASFAEVFGCTPKPDETRSPAHLERVEHVATIGEWVTPRSLGRVTGIR